jgi:hypothetical protein
MAAEKRGVRERNNGDGGGGDRHGGGVFQRLEQQRSGGGVHERLGARVRYEGDRYDGDRYDEGGGGEGGGGDGGGRGGGRGGRRGGRGGGYMGGYHPAQLMMGWAPPFSGGRHGGRGRGGRGRGAVAAPPADNGPKLEVVRAQPLHTPLPTFPCLERRHPHQVYHHLTLVAAH